MAAGTRQQKKKAKRQAAIAKPLKKERNSRVQNREFYSEVVDRKWEAAEGDTWILTLTLTAPGRNLPPKEFTVNSRWNANRNRVKEQLTPVELEYFKDAMKMRNEKKKKSAPKRNKKGRKATKKEENDNDEDDDGEEDASNDEVEDENGEDEEQKEEGEELARAQMDEDNDDGEENNDEVENGGGEEVEEEEEEETNEHDENMGEGQEGDEDQNPAENDDETGPVQVLAKFHHIPRSDDGLLFLKGDTITVVQRRRDGRWKGEFRGKTGWFPSIYVVAVSDPPAPSEGSPNERREGLQIAVALHSFDATTTDQLSFRQGQYLEILEHSEWWWWLARTESGASGLVPIDFLKVESSNPRYVLANPVAVVAKHSYDAPTNEYLSFKKGDRMDIIEYTDQWSRIARSRSGATGVVLLSCVEMVSNTPTLARLRPAENDNE